MEDYLTSVVIVLIILYIACTYNTFEKRGYIHTETQYH